MSDASLKAQIDSDRAERKKYIKVKNAISNHGLDQDISLKHFTKYIDECKDAIKKIDGNEGYHYLSTMKTKLQDSSISSNKSKYNKGKPIWEWIW